jgi:hypothetical protein
MNKNISDKILEKIKEDKIRPKAKWEFLLKDYFIWSLFGFCLFLGSLASSVVIYLMRNNDWDLYKYASGSFFEFFFITLPYFWLIIFIIFIVVAFINFKHTKKGYLFSLGKVIFFCLFLSFILGGAVYAAGFGKMIDNALSDKLPYYNCFMEHRREIWNQPGRGILAGRIIDAEQKHFTLIDVEGENRCVDCQILEVCEFAKRHIGKNIKIVGKEDDPCFRGQMIRLWREGMMERDECLREDGARVNRCRGFMK